MIKTLKTYSLYPSKAEKNILRSSRKYLIKINEK